MNIIYGKKFHKDYLKLDNKIKKQANQRIKLFCENIYNPILDNHKLKGEYKACRSIDISGDFRLVYKESPQGVFSFIRIGTHSELYG